MSSHALYHFALTEDQSLLRDAGYHRGQEAAAVSFGLMLGVGIGFGGSILLGLVGGLAFDVTGAVLGIVLGLAASVLAWTLCSKEADRHRQLAAETERLWMAAHQHQLRVGQSTHAPQTPASAS